VTGGNCSPLNFSLSDNSLLGGKRHKAENCAKLYVDLYLSEFLQTDVLYE